ncbi:MAG TPA: hypothetical protein PKL09_01595 [bacterium]|nr:hypothetical protein [bacterium]HNS33633.1 hypothetical protein [bacterium]HNZ73223.1 hypothetical protein [bacterium]HOH67087.1 hypothetical protein [bacterium]HQA64150.1 hypothetical protein [bacterium]
MGNIFSNFSFIYLFLSLALLMAPAMIWYFRFVSKSNATAYFGILSKYLRDLTALV